MARLGSSSCCRPLLQGMMLLSLLLLASIQAGPVIAQEEFFAGVAEQFHHGVEEVRDHAPDLVNKGFNKGLNKGLTVLSKEKPVLKPSIDGVKTGLKVHRYLCKAQGLMDKQNPGGASGTPSFAVDILGGDLLSKSFPTTLYYSVTSNSGVPCHWSADLPQVQAAGTTLFPSRYPPATMSLRITRIRVGQEEIPVKPPAYLSTAQPAYTDPEISLYSFLLREAVNRTMKATTTIATADADQLCYMVPKGSLPRIAILLGSDNGGVMQTTELSVDATGTVWYPESFTFCLGIRTTVELILGRP